MRVIDADDLELRRQLAQQPPYGNVLSVIDAEASRSSRDVAHRQRQVNAAIATSQQPAALARPIPFGVRDDGTAYLGWEIEHETPRHDRSSGRFR